MASLGLERYAELIGKYHRSLDLMSARAVENLPGVFAEAQVYADFMAPRLSPNDHLLDVGSGVGLPGILLALAFPQHRVTLVERRQRRSNFLRIVVGQLGLKNVNVICADVTRTQMPPCQWVTAQAVGSFPLLYCLTRHLHAPEVTILARRADVDLAEIATLEAFAGEALEVGSLPVVTHGKLVGIRLQGAQPCPSSV